MTDAPPSEPAPAPPVEAPPVVEANVAKDEPQPDSDPVPTKRFSWLDPHPEIVVVFVGSDETAFSLQKDLLCSISRYFRDQLRKSSTTTNGATADEGKAGPKDVESTLHLSDVSVEAFSYAQQFIYTGQVLPEGSNSSTDREMPSYDLLVDIWKLGDRLGIDGLCERALEAMAENKRLTQSIPATNILVQVWRDTPEGSTIRQLLLSWAAEYLRSSEERRSEFAKALPQELLSELVVAMSTSFGEIWGTPTNVNDGNGESRNGETGSGPTNGKHYIDDDYDDSMQGTGGDSSVNGNGSIHYRGSPPATKRARFFDSYPVHNGNGSSPATPSMNASPAVGAEGSGRKPLRTALPSAQRVIPKKRTAQAGDLTAYTPEQKLLFCSDLLTRMLSGPGFWTRLVGPFREPVDPTSEGIPDYFEKVKRPMDLGTIKANLDNHRYKTPEEFYGDMNQIFSNVYTYWKRTDSIWAVCERLEKTFEEKYSHMYKWLVKHEDDFV
ncbi:hypothetical protein SEUCBS140593_007563 [Sporothrix eucalyptigena]|uniref:Uncharacterized protein n=1 Tax=Sporothrix eucalyptigena TaxID=1812306 RepID=A0ABP0CGV3_9PEZI